MKLWFVRWYLGDDEEYAFYVEPTSDAAIKRFQRYRIDTDRGTYVAKELSEVDGFEVVVRGFEQPR